MRRILEGLILVMAASFIVVSAGEASEGRLQPVGGGTVVIVWRNARAQEEGLALIRAGVNKSDPSRLLPFISCIVTPGTKAVTTSARIFFSTDEIQVVEGKHAGCRGSVPLEVFKRE
jgi:hypothetical protein